MTSTENIAGVVPLEEERRRRQAGPPVAFDDLDALDTAGAMLAAARQAAGLTVEACGERLNLTSAKVAAIEGMRTTDLPAPPFTLGFVRAYAALLDLPADALTERYRREAGYPGRDARPAFNSRVQKDLGSPPQAGLFAVLIVIGVLAYVLWQVLQSVAPDEAVSPPERFPLAMNDSVPAAVTYETEATLADRVDLPGAENLGPTTAEEEATPAEAVAPELTDIEKLQASIQPDDPMVLIPGPIPPSVKPTDAERIARAEARRQAALAAARAAAEAVAAETDEGAETTASPLEESSALAPTGSAVPETAAATDAPAISDSDVESVPANATAPVRLLAVEPVYPVRCEVSANAEEAVTISYRVSRFGKVLNPEVQSTTNPCFNRAAMAAVARWDFTPSQANGQPVASPPQSTRIVFRKP